MLDLTELHAGDLLIGHTVKKTDGVEAKVTSCTAGPRKHLSKGDGADDLGEANPEENLAHSTLLDEGVMGGHRGEALVGLGKGVDANAKVDRDEAGPGQHADAAMFDLGFAEEVHRGEVGESERVEANITDVSLEIRWSGEEGKCLRWL